MFKVIDKSFLSKLLIVISILWCAVLTSVGWFATLVVTANLFVIHKKLFLLDKKNIEIFSILKENANNQQNDETQDDRRVHY